MTSGGARSRSGPQPDPNSMRSKQRGISMSKLPADGYSGTVPNLADFLPVVTDRHLSIWNELWTTPQADAWSHEPWRWPIVADLVKWSVRSEDPEAPVGTATAVRQLRDDCGLSSAGLKQNGWTIAPVVANDPADDAPTAPADDVVDIGSARNRLRG